MTTLVKMILVKCQLKRDGWEEYNWRCYKDMWNVDITPTLGLRVFVDNMLCIHLLTPDGRYTSRIRKGSKLYKWVLKQRSFGGSWGKYYIIPPSW